MKYNNINSTILTSMMLQKIFLTDNYDTFEQN